MHFTDDPKTGPFTLWHPFLTLGKSQPGCVLVEFLVASAASTTEESNFIFSREALWLPNPACQRRIYVNYRFYDKN